MGIEIKLRREHGRRVHSVALWVGAQEVILLVMTVSGSFVLEKEVHQAGCRAYRADDVGRAIVLLQLFEAKKELVVTELARRVWRDCWGVICGRITMASVL